MDAEVTLQVNARKSERTPDRRQYRSGYRDRNWDTRLGTIHLSIPKVHNDGYVPCFLERSKQAGTALISIVIELYTQGISTRKLENFVRSIGLYSLPKSKASDMVKALNAKAEAFRN